ncbi:hypothetical protein [Helicobacter ibis]|uniref:Uncharacterized protein n=1 Tax=Helicobacter ibis TaxID=2962633 RepID=A0ABT4VF87_9HELI|nr:hypothetical protein [Helicobacter ibis]MDA3969376.1 hypothetical protein [Helicobacter ibis]
MQIQIDTTKEYKYTSPSMQPFEIMEYFPLHIKLNSSILKQTESFKDSAKTPPPPQIILIYLTIHH